MAANCRFAFAVHLLALLAAERPRALTSEVLARSVNTHPVVVRRLLSTLRRAGLVCCAPGCHGGAILCKAPGEITLDEIYRAVQPAAAFTAHAHEPNRRCPVGRQIGEALVGIFSDAQSALESELARHTLCDLVAAMAARETESSAA